MSKQKSPLPPMTEPDLHHLCLTLPLPDTTAQAGRVPATQAVLAIQNGVDRTRHGQVLIHKLQACE